MNEDAKNKVIGKINEIKSNIETFIADVNVNDLKASFNLMVKDAQKDFNKLVNKDLQDVKKKLQKERQDIEKKAKKFLDGHRKELDTLQAKLEKLIKSGSKVKGKKAPATAKAAVPATKKQVRKKVAKATKKVSKKA